MRLQIIVNLFAVIYAENIRNQRIIHCSRKLNIFRRFFAKNVEENVEVKYRDLQPQPNSSLSFSAIALEALPLWLIEFFCSLVIWAVVMPNSGT